MPALAEELLPDSGLCGELCGQLRAGGAPRVKQILMCRNEVGLQQEGVQSWRGEEFLWGKGPAGWKGDLSHFSPDPLGPHRLGLFPSYTPRV